MWIVADTARLLLRYTVILEICTSIKVQLDDWEDTNLAVLSTYQKAGHHSELRKHVLSSVSKSSLSSLLAPYCKHNDRNDVMTFILMLCTYELGWNMLSSMSNAANICFYMYIIVHSKLHVLIHAIPRTQVHMYSSTCHTTYRSTYVLNTCHTT